MIGIFDSGMGGLTVLSAIREVLPSSDVVYFGDTLNAPYGVRSREDLTKLTVEGLQLLQKRGANNIVSACNSVSASLAVSLFDALSLAPQQLIEMVGPTVAYFKGSAAPLVLCATPATIQSGIYQNAFRMIGRDVQGVAIEPLAGAIENGATAEEIEAIIAAAFKGTVLEPGSILILACTHYPIVISAFRKVLGSDVTIFDPAFAVAERAEKQFWPQEVGDGRTTFILSKDSEPFRALAAKLFPNTKFEVEVLQ
ncbi:MAG: Glutamate racemase [Candidatus Kaiserbacteria bacterium]|nr:Glutamate racemase [Candidatus Kaiserbacteria bacterium]